MAGEELAKKYQSAIYLAGSASAEFFADIALCPFEAVKVRLLRSRAHWLHSALNFETDPCDRDASASSPRLYCPQVKVQTVPGFARGLADGFPKVIALEGTAG
jgi:solute carrier family 25 phosphate transporter 3